MANQIQQEKAVVVQPANAEELLNPYLSKGWTVDSLTPFASDNYPFILVILKK